MIKVLASLPRTNNHGFAGGNIPALRAKDTKLWNGLRVQIGKPKLRLHDLRHSFASVAVNSGLDLQVVGGLLGHSDLGTTAGYAHLDEMRITAASQRVG
ncbi:MAG: tyrosine-type recombinase/integrase [Rhodobacteraceae bacterium]|nr:tyrosine-type recombinase/integrase [Paracoccaceae bacterium]